MPRTNFRKFRKAAWRKLVSAAEDGAVETSPPEAKLTIHESTTPDSNSDASLTPAQKLALSAAALTLDDSDTSTSNIASPAENSDEVLIIPTEVAALAHNETTPSTVICTETRITNPARAPDGSYITPAKSGSETQIKTVTTRSGPFIKTDINAPESDTSGPKRKPGRPRKYSIGSERRRAPRKPRTPREVNSNTPSPPPSPTLFPTHRPVILDTTPANPRNPTIHDANETLNAVSGSPAANYLPYRYPTLTMQEFKALCNWLHRLAISICGSSGNQHPLYNAAAWAPHGIATCTPDWTRVEPTTLFSTSLAHAAVNAADAWIARITVRVCYPEAGLKEFYTVEVRMEREVVSAETREFVVLLAHWEKESVKWPPRVGECLAGLFGVAGCRDWKVGVVDARDGMRAYYRA